MDIETVEFDGKQIPVVITFAYSIKSISDLGLLNQHPNLSVEQIKSLDNNIKTIYVQINYKESNTNNVVSMVKDLWYRFFMELNDVIKQHNIAGKTKNRKIVIFLHNLGKFDGLYLYKGLIYLNNLFNYKEINTIIDKENRFISIESNLFGNKLIFKDSLRVFDVSLDQLCNIFVGSGKANLYKAKYNKLSIFTNTDLFNEFKHFSLQDSIQLLKALLVAQSLYFKDQSVDIATIWSTSSLSMKIFRSNYLPKDIPVLTKTEDSFIRTAYFGGATDFYKMYGEGLYHYDVNSLYPYVMCKPMPYKIINYHYSMPFNSFLKENDSMFGFFLAEITAPDNIKIPLLPLRLGEEGKVVYPKGKWKGVYFSELLKAVVKHGYKVRLITGYEFSQTLYFNDYINHFYNMKKISTGAQRHIAKMHLNQLYGYFGRSLNLLHTEPLNGDEMKACLRTKVVENIIHVDGERFLALCHSNIKNKIIK